MILPSCLFHIGNTQREQDLLNLPPPLLGTSCFLHRLSPGHAPRTQAPVTSFSSGRGLTRLHFSSGSGRVLWVVLLLGLRRCLASVLWKLRSSCSVAASSVSLPCKTSVCTLDLDLVSSTRAEPVHAPKMMAARSHCVWISEPVLILRRRQAH